MFVLPFARVTLTSTMQGRDGGSNMMLVLPAGIPPPRANSVHGALADARTWYPTME
jgi:hypothetical protein